MPDFGALGIAAVVCIVFWLWKEDAVKRNHILEKQRLDAEDRADRALQLLEDVLGFAGDLVKKLNL